MKNITWNKVKTTVKGWQVGDYIRQTSIVVIGVLITFAGSELVTQNSEKKDIQATMSLIRDELKSNRENYESIVSEFREDERLSSLLVEYDLKHRTIPEDSLIQFRFLMGHIRSFYYSQNALDILKNSMLMQKISDKELLLQLTGIYEVLDGFRATMNGYYDMKDEIMVPFHLALTDEQTDQINRGGYEAWDIYLSDRSVRNFVRVARNYFTPDYVERCLLYTSDAADDRISDYFRQFSIVAAAIIVTFWGNDRITENARQKEVRATMQLVTEELEYNRQELRNIKHLLDIDIHMSLLLREHDMDVSKIPTDTLWKYGKFFNNMDEFSYRTDALDVLKGSSLMQYIPDKRMLQDVLQTYFELGRKQKDVSDYYATKTDALMSAAMSREWANVFDGGDGLRDQALFLVQYKKFINYVNMVPGFLYWHEFDELDERLAKQIQVLKAKYK